LIFLKEDLIRDLKQNIIEIIFKKKDGTIRTIKATLKPEFLPQDICLPEETKEINFLELNAEQIIEICKDKTELWVNAFIQYVPEADRNIMAGWFQMIIDAVSRGNIKESRNDDDKPLIVVWDIQSNGWRSFNINDVKSAQILDHY